MQTFNLTINVAVSSVGNLTVPAGAVVKTDITGIGMSLDNDSVGYITTNYASQSDLDNGEAPIFIKGLNSDLNTSRGIQAHRGGLEDVTGDNIQLELVNGRLCLDAASLAIVKAKVITKLATDLQIDETDIS